MWQTIVGLIAVMAANILLGSTLAKMKEMFEKENFLKGIYKIITVVLSVGLMYVCSTLNPDIFVVNINGTSVNLIEAIRLISIMGIMFYGAQTVSKLVEIIGLSTKNIIPIETENIEENINKEEK